MSVKWCRKSWTESGGLFLLERPELVGRGQPDKSNLHCQQIFTFLPFNFLFHFFLGWLGRNLHSQQYFFILFLFFLSRLVWGAIYILNNIYIIAFTWVIIAQFFLVLRIFGEQFGYFLLRNIFLIISAFHGPLAE